MRHRRRRRGGEFELSVSKVIAVIGSQGVSQSCNEARGDETALMEEDGCEGITAIAGEEEGLKQNGIETWP